MSLCAAFEHIDQARGATSLTYFEFGTLAALEIFAQAALDVAVLEVGLGGRLDAVNIVDADVALISSIGIDHIEWLGPDRESIGREKAGILRPATPAVYGEADPPHSVLTLAESLAAPLHCLERDYRYSPATDSWDWRSDSTSYTGLPLPNLPGAFQLQNAAAVLMVLELMAQRLPVAAEALHAGLRAVRLPGRFQVLPRRVEWILDVAHNPHAARALAEALRQRPCAGRTHLVLAMLVDKDVVGVCAALRPVVDVWYCAGLAGARGQSGTQLAALAGLAEPEMGVYADVTSACAHAAATATAGDRIVVCGSFHTVSEALQYQM
jgi:dihydrofolate synthase/folylpolyglutamate synthase